MLTVRHIKANGEEVLEQVDRIEFKPEAAGPGSGAINAERLDDRLQFTGGTIFVMNDLGKTVARYDLGASPVPYSATAYPPAMQAPR